MARNTFRNFSTYKIDPLTEIRNAGIVTNGEVYWVSSVSDSDHTERTGNLGRTAVKTTLQAAIDQTEDNGNDYILVIPTDGGTVRPLTEGVNVNKGRVHILGVGAGPAPMGDNGYTFRGFATTSTVDTELLNVSAEGVELGGVKFVGTSTTSANGSILEIVQIGTAASGTPHGLWMHDVHFEETSAAADNGTVNIINISGNVAGGILGMRFDRIWAGNFSFAPAAVVAMAGTAGPTRPVFTNSTFVINAQATSDDFVVMGTGVMQYTLFDNCEFINVNAGTAPASALTGAILAGNPTHLRNCTYLNVTQGGTDTEAYKSPVASGTSAVIRDYGIAVGTAALTPV